MKSIKKVRRYRNLMIIYLSFILFQPAFLLAGWKLVDRVYYPGGDKEYEYRYECISCADNNNCIAVGNIMLSMPWFRASSDGGETWTTCYADSNYLRNLAIRPCKVWEVAYLDTNLCIAFGDSNTVWRSSDKCRTWSRTVLAGKFLVNQYPTFRISTDNNLNIGMVSTCDLFLSNDSAKSFKKILIDIDDTLKPMGFDDISLPSENCVIILAWRSGSNSYILSSSDFGISWVTNDPSPKPIESIFFINNSTGWACGRQQVEYGSSKFRNIILKTTDGGKNWEVQLDTLDYFQTGLEKIKFIDSLNGLAMGYRWNVWRTSNGGKQWYKDTTVNYNALEYFPTDIAFLGNGDLIASSLMDRIYKYYSETGVEDNIAANELVVSPNPAGDFIEIAYPNSDLSFLRMQESIKIFNVLGEEVRLLNQRSTTPPYGHPFELEGEALKIDISFLPAGIYFVRVGEKVGKFVKM